MDFLAVVVLAKIFKQCVGRLDLVDSFGPEKRGQAVLDNAQRRTLERSVSKGMRRCSSLATKL